jgi:N-acetylglucosamine kinase-like BadF-type ATPase
MLGSPSISTGSAVLAIDGGNSKSVAVVSTTEGIVLGYSIGGCGDIYGAATEEDALSTLARAATAALGEADVLSTEVKATAASLAGADWPEDFELLKRELVQRVGLQGPTVVLNDGLGPLRLGDPAGLGVAVALGTGIAIGARGPSGRTWNASFWLPFSMTTLGDRALNAVYRAELGLTARSTLTERLLSHFGLSDVETLLHAFTARSSVLSLSAKQQVGAVLLEEDADGDEVARDIVSGYARQLAEYAIVAAKKTGLNGSFYLVLTGGVLRNRRSTLACRLAEEVRAEAPLAQPVLPNVAPVAGAILEAIALASGGIVRRDVQERVASTALLEHLSATQSPLLLPGTSLPM